MSSLKLKINDFAKPGNLDTQKLFDVSYIEPKKSSIDTFFIKTKTLNTLIVDPNNVDVQLTNLILLGYVSAVESYFRGIIRKSISIDMLSKKTCENQLLTFGAAISHDKELLPEALLEKCTFINKENINESLKNYLGLKGQFPSDVENVLEQYGIVCQLRHCIVHRFGLLGSNNAIKLGLSEHKEFLEKPLKINYSSLQEVFLICNNTVKVFNNYLFQRLLQRSVEECGCWQWNYNKDKKLFNKYFTIFYSGQYPPTPNVIAKDIYNQFRLKSHEYNKSKKWKP
jgi:hypothetical protein